MAALQQQAGNRAVADLVQGRSGGIALPQDIRSEMESRFGADFRDVRIHTDGDAQQSARALRAKAYTVGRDISFSEGRFAPQTGEGRRLLAHELAHVVQQSRGGPAPRADAPDAALEGGADAAAAQAVSGAGAVSVPGASGVGVACEGENKDDPALASALLDLKKAKSECNSHHRRTEKFEWPSKMAFDFGPMPEFGQPDPTEVVQPGAHGTPIGVPIPQATRDRLEADRKRAVKPPSFPQWVDLQPKEDKDEPKYRFVPSEEMYLDPLLDRPTAQRKLREEHALLKRILPGTEKILEQDPYYMRAMGRYAPLKDDVPILFVPQGDAAVRPPTVLSPDPSFPSLTRPIVLDNPDYWKTARGKFRRSLSQNIKALRNDLDRLEGMRKDIIGGSTVFRKVGENMAGGIDPPPAKDLYGAFDLLRSASKDLEKDDVEGAQAKYERARGLRQKISWEWSHYWTFLEHGLNQEIEALENVRDVSKYSLMVMSMGTGAGAMWAGTLGVIAIDATDQAGKAALGEKVDWGKFAAETAVQLVLARFGGAASKGILARISKIPGFEGATESIVLESLMNGAFARASTGTVKKLADGKGDMTWGQVAEHVFDPRAAAFDVLLGQVAQRLSQKGASPADKASAPQDGAPALDLAPAAPLKQAPAQSAPPRASLPKAPIPITDAKQRSGPATQLKGPTGQGEPISIGRARKPAKSDPPDTVPDEQAVPVEVPRARAAGDRETFQPGPRQPANDGDAVMNAAPRGPTRKDGKVSPIRPAAPIPAGGKGATSARGATAPRTKSAAKPPPAAKSASDNAKLLSMDKWRRYEAIERQHPGATGTEWTKSADVRKLNGEGTLVLHVEPGMNANDVRRKADALNSLAPGGGLKKSRGAERQTVPDPLNPAGPKVPLSTAHRNQIIEHIHRQAKLQGWSDKRKFAAIAKALRTEGDHVKDLQLGGVDHANNVWLIDAYTNWRLGKHIERQLANLPEGAVIKKVIVVNPP